MRVTRGTNPSIPLTITNGGVAVDLTGATVYFTVKRKTDQKKDDSDAIIKKTITSHTDPTHGKTFVIFTTSDTDQDIGDYIHDIVVKKGTDILKTNTCTFSIVKPVTEIV